MVGVVGEVDRMQGDAISRLEGLTKFHDASFLVQAAQCLKDGVPETWTGEPVMITK